jgi:hypothetical protein
MFAGAVVVVVDVVVVVAGARDLPSR